jgi:iron complex transport system ATP-binding protein
MRIQASNLKVRYPGARDWALDDVSLDVAPGTLYAVLGPNGSGKSSLLRALLGSVPRQGGSVHLDGRPLEGWARLERARVVGAVSQQEPVTFPIRAEALVAMGRYPHLGPIRSFSPQDMAYVHEAMERCGVAHLKDRDAGTLSGGEYQRVRIARALAQRPKALMLDEPTASLDLRHEMQILGVLREATQAGITVFLITHHLDIAARFADRILLLGCGRVAAEGAPSDVLREDVLAHVYGWPLRVRTDPETGALRVIPVDPAEVVHLDRSEGLEP